MAQSKHTNTVLQVDIFSTLCSLTNLIDHFCVLENILMSKRKRCRRHYMPDQLYYDLNEKVELCYAAAYLV